MQVEQETRDLLDEEVAMRILGYRWVAWKNRERFPAPEEEEGRFLAPPDGPLAAEQTPVGAEVPFAKEPDRYLPQFSSDLRTAFELAREVGLFLHTKAFLDPLPAGGWRVVYEDGEVLGEGNSLPEAICRAVLAWHEAHHRPESSAEPE